MRKKHVKSGGERAIWKPVVGNHRVAKEPSVNQWWECPKEHSRLSTTGYPRVGHAAGEHVSADLMTSTMTKHAMELGREVGIVIATEMRFSFEFEDRGGGKVGGGVKPSVVPTENVAPARPTPPATPIEEKVAMVLIACLTTALVTALVVVLRRYSASRGRNTVNDGSIERSGNQWWDDHRG